MKKQFTTENLLQKMENIVKRTLKSYKSDFYNYDVSMINTIDSKKEKQRLVWIVRELGTFLIYIDGTEEEKKASNDFFASDPRNMEQQKRISDNIQRFRLEHQ